MNSRIRLHALFAWDLPPHFRCRIRAARAFWRILGTFTKIGRLITLSGQNERRPR
jgi:hypothetical protein